MCMSTSLSNFVNICIMYFEIIITDASGTGVGSNTCNNVNGFCECFYGKAGALAPIGGCCTPESENCVSNKCAA